jgi:FkbM family methyltransferase
MDQQRVSLLRRVAERLSRGIVLKRRMPSAFGGGPILVSPESGLKYWRKDLSKIDPVLFRMATELVREGDVVWDVGANVGLFAFAAAARAGPKGRVVAVEPDLWLASLLGRSTALEAPRRAPVTVLPTAVSDAMNLAQLHIAARSRSANYLDGTGSTQAGGAREMQWTVTLSLDWLLHRLPAPNVLKIDVEAMEHRVLAGAVELLSTARPRIWCEVASENAAAVTQSLHAANYVLYDGSREASARQPLEVAGWDTLALPR